MKANDILSKIKNIVGEKTELSEDQPKVELAEITLENGTILVAESFKGGESVFIKTEDKEVALPVGEYELEDGKLLIVKEDGLIDSIKEAAEEVADEEELSEDSENSKEVKETELEEEEEKEEMKYVTKEEFTSAVDEIKAYIDQKLGDKEEMKEAVTEEVKEELSAQAPEPIKHNPESQVQKANIKFAQNRVKTTKDRVFDKIFQNN
jgi:hypothetical protein